MTDESTTAPKTDFKIYKSDKIKEEALGIPEQLQTYSETLSAAKTKDGLIPVQLEYDVIVDRVSRAIYSNPVAGYRELFNNEARACRQAIRDYQAKPRIEVTVNTTDRMLRIHGVDSLGMTEKKFVEIYTVLGRGDNFDSTEVGQFGLGRSAYTCLTDLMRMEVFSRESNEKFAVLGKNGKGFEILPKPKDLFEYGTRITLYLREDIDIQKLIEYIVQASRLSGIDVTLTLEGNYSKITGTFMDINGRVHKIEKGTYQISPVTLKNFVKQKIKAEIGSYREYSESIEVELETEDYHFYGEATMVNHYDSILRDIDGSTSNDRVYLIGSPVECALDSIAPLSCFAIRLKDERKFKPTADRERIDPELVKDIIKKAIDQLKSKFAFLDVKTWEALYASKYRAIIAQAYHNNVSQFLSKETDNAVAFARIDLEFRGKHREPLFKQDFTKLLYDPGLSKEKQQAIEAIDGSVRTFRLTKHYRSKDNEEEKLELLEKLFSFGVRRVRDFMKEHRVRIKRDPTERKTTFEGYDSYGRKLVLREDDIDEYCIRAPKEEVQAIRDSLVHGCSYKVVKEIKRLPEGYGITIPELVEQIGAHEFETQLGTMTLADIVGLKKEIKVVIYDEDNKADLQKAKEILAITTKNPHVFIQRDAHDEMFELTFLAGRMGVEYDTTHTIHILRDQYKPRLQELGLDFNGYDYRYITEPVEMSKLIEIIEQVKDKRLLNLFKVALKDIGGQYAKAIESKESKCDLGEKEELALSIFKDVVELNKSLSGEVASTTLSGRHSDRAREALEAILQSKDDTEMQKACKSFTNYREGLQRKNKE